MRRNTRHGSGRPQELFTVTDVDVFHVVRFVRLCCRARVTQAAPNSGTNLRGICIEIKKTGAAYLAKVGARSNKRAAC